MTNESLFLFDANNDVFYVRQMFKILNYWRWIQFTMFSLKSMIKKPNNLFQKKSGVL